MARNAEKAMTALARWRNQQLEDAKPKERRPAMASECDDVEKAQKWRSQVIREISKKISQIQNPGLGEFKIRDLNDEINSFLRQKGHWEVRIKELGGPDFLKVAPKWFNREGKEVPGMAGYKYFGAAKDLPGVREIIEQPVQAKTRPTRAELMKYIDADYYGYMDDDDGILIPLEMAAQQKAIAEAVSEYEKKKSAGAPPVQAQTEEPDIYQEAAAEAGVDSDDVIPLGPRPLPVDVDETGQPHYIAHVPAVPSQKEVEEALLEQKKRDLLEKYASESLIHQSEQARAIMGYEPAR